MLNRKTIRLLAFLLWAVGLPCLSAQTAQVEGTVRDASGAVIANASVVLSSDSYQVSARTDAGGHFLFPAVPSISGTVEISRDGFNPVRQSWNAGPTAAVSLEIVLQPASASEQVTVSAARTEVRLSETPGSTILLTSTDVTATPALRVDDVLRQVPGFSLYRRSDSRTANASNQGVSLRGLGGPPPAARWCSKMDSRWLMRSEAGSTGTVFPERPLPMWKYSVAVLRIYTAATRSAGSCNS